ncbi:hypothetical protein ACIQU4_10845 [Streptomyces sp. NPDC090741]
MPAAQLAAAADRRIRGYAMPGDVVAVFAEALKTVAGETIPHP